MRPEAVLSRAVKQIQRNHYCAGRSFQEKVTELLQVCIPIRCGTPQLCETPFEQTCPHELLNGP